ncbi:hypothetical protein [Motilimonas cestriensis]|uniref:hypothetical protein n=1 Tax=Motilimonas cestriensis TaxID=2742685 RepID=UPI003DA3E01F
MNIHNKTQLSFASFLSKLASALIIAGFVGLIFSGKSELECVASIAIGSGMYLVSLFLENVAHIQLEKKVRKPFKK